MSQTILRAGNIYILQIRRWGSQRLIGLLKVNQLVSRKARIQTHVCVGTPEPCYFLESIKTVRVSKVNSRGSLDFLVLSVRGLLWWEKGFDFQEPSCKRHEPPREPDRSKISHCPVKTNGTVFKNKDSGMGLNGYPRWGWVDHLVSLILSFLICEMGRAVSFIFRVCCEH